jgi:hypothetical protein
MRATTSSMGGGAKGASAAFPLRRAIMTISSAGMLPVSKIWLQR